MKTLLLIPLLLLAGEVYAENQEMQKDLFVVVTSDDSETQMMAMVLATQSLNQGVQVRVLLCGGGGYLATEGHESRVFQPANRSPKELLSGLISNGVKVEVCGIFLPNRDLTETDLIDGVTAASPPEVAEYMRQEGVRYFTF
jgi:predicted peroxiredoxin